METTQLGKAMALGALSGIRSAAAPAIVSEVRHRRDRGLITEVQLPRGLRPLLSLLAAGELVADKLSITPARIHPASLVVRAMSGALVGSVFARKGEARIGPAAAGASAALAATFASYGLRRLAIHRSKVL